MVLYRSLGFHRRAWFDCSRAQCFFALHAVQDFEKSSDQSWSVWILCCFPWTAIILINYSFCDHLIDFTYMCLDFLQPFHIFFFFDCIDFELLKWFFIETRRRITVYELAIQIVLNYTTGTTLFIGYSFVIHETVCICAISRQMKCLSLCSLHNIFDTHMQMPNTVLVPLEACFDLLQLLAWVTWCHIRFLTNGWASDDICTWQSS